MDAAEKLIHDYSKKLACLVFVPLNSVYQCKIEREKKLEREKGKKHETHLTHLESVSKK